jgi:hypothetical protein
MRDPDPMCMHSTVPVSSAASKTGAQYPDGSWIDGNRRWWGISGNVMASIPRAALRLISSAAAAGSHNGTMPSGSSRPPAGAHHSSTIQSL